MMTTSQSNELFNFWPLCRLAELSGGFYRRSGKQKRAAMRLRIVASNNRIRDMFNAHFRVLRIRRRKQRLLHVLISKPENETSILFLRVSDACAFPAMTFDAPACAVLDKSHLRSFSPPPVDFSGKGHPDTIVLLQSSEIVEQGLVHLALSCFEDIVGMDDEIHETMVLHDQGDLLLPPVERIVVENVKQGVVLGHRHRKFEQFSVKERKDSAASTALRVKMRHIGDGHVIREIQCVVPLEVPM